MLNMPSQEHQEPIADATTPAQRSKRQEKKEKRREEQRVRDVEQPKVRTAHDRYRAFIEQCAAVVEAGNAGHPVVVDEAYIEKHYPKKFENHGHVVVVQLNHADKNSVGVAGPSPPTTASLPSTEDDNCPLLAEFRRIAAPFAKSLQSRPDVVVVDTNGIGGELRRPIHEVVWRAGDAAAPTGSGPAFSAEECFAPIRQAAANVVRKRERAAQAGAAAAGTFSDPLAAPLSDAFHQANAAKYNTYTPTITFTTHIENKTRYSFDVMRVMFSSGNTEIRMHFGTIKEAKDEIVVDMFAGIGYFTIPLAMHGKPAMLYALEKNPDSAEYLQMNAYQNNVADKVTVMCGDNREVAGTLLDGKCDRVLMGYIPSCKEFVPKAVQFLKRAPCTRSSGESDNTRSPATRPVGTIHYHYLAGKDDAEAVALADIAAGLSSGLAGPANAADDALLHVGTDYRVGSIFQVKSYSPKVWHYVADVVFGK